MKRIAKITLMTLLVLGMGVWFGRQYLLQQVVLHALEKRQVPVQSLHVDHFSKNHIVLSNLSLGNAGEVKANRLDITLVWDGSTLTIMDATAQQLQIRAHVGSDGMTLGGIERLWDIVPKNAATALTIIELNGDMKLHYEIGGAVHVELLEDVLQLSRDDKAMLLPLKISGTVDGDITKQLKVNARFSSEKNEIQGKANGSYDMPAQTGKFQWETEPMELSPAGMQFAQVSPRYAAGITTFPLRATSAGTVLMNGVDWSVTPTITLVQMPLAPVLASALGEGTQVEGIIGGTVPLRVTPTGWWIEPASMNNIGALHVAIASGSPSAAALANHPQAAIVLGALSNFQVDVMTLDIKSSDHHGGIVLQWHFVGKNPDFMGGRKVDFTLAVTANLEDMLRSTASAESMVGQTK